MSAFDKVLGKYQVKVETPAETIIENSLDAGSIPVVYNFEDLLRLKNLPLRFDKQDHDDASVRYRYVIETKEEYQLSATTLIENGSFSIMYNCTDFDDDGETDLPPVSIVWEFQDENLKMIPVRVEKL
jgi:hypothetical protein